MTRSRLLLLIAIPVLVGLYLWDRANSSESTLPAVVADIQENSGDGPDTWDITVEIGGQTVPLSTQNARPTFNVGDSLCVVQTEREGERNTYRPAPSDALC